MNNLKITGEVESYLTKPNGEVYGRKIDHNTIFTDFYKRLATYLTSHAFANLIELDDLFVADDYPDTDNGEDGIVTNYNPNNNEGVIGRGRSFICVASQPAANQFRMTGTFTNGGVNSETLKEVCLGQEFTKNNGWETVGDGGFFQHPIAYGGMADTPVPAGETLTVVWTITFTVH